MQARFEFTSFLFQESERTNEIMGATCIEENKKKRRGKEWSDTHPHTARAHRHTQTHTQTLPLVLLGLRIQPLHPRQALLLLLLPLKIAALLPRYHPLPSPLDLHRFLGSALLLLLSGEIRGLGKKEATGSLPSRGGKNKDKKIQRDNPNQASFSF